MAEESKVQTTATPSNGSPHSLPNNSDSTWNYIWDDKLCKTTLKLFNPTVYTPPILSLADDGDQKRYVCPIEECKRSFAKEHRSEFRLHLKRHLPESEKPFKCDQPECTRAFVRCDELANHKLSHTGEKPYKCEQCGKAYTRSHRLGSHLRTHFKETKMNSQNVGGDDSDAAIDFESDDSSSSSLIPSDLDGPLKQEVDTEADTDTETDEEDHLHEMNEIKAEPEKITEPLLPAFYSSDQRIHINEAKTQEAGVDDSLNASNNFKYNDSASSALFPIKLEVPGKQDIYTETNKYDVPMKLEVPLKQEMDTEPTYEYDSRFEDFDQYVMKRIKEEPEMAAEPYFPDFYSSRESNSMSAAIHRLVNPMATNNIKLASKPTNNIESESVLPTTHLIDFPLPIVANNIKSKSKPKPVPKSKPSNTTESEYKPIKKPYKCSVEGCDRAFKVPYGLKRHSWVHTKVKTFECDKCMKRFLRKDHLGKHMKTHSRIPIIKYPKRHDE